MFIVLCNPEIITSGHLFGQNICYKNLKITRHITQGGKHLTSAVCITGLQLH